TARRSLPLHRALPICPVRKAEYLGGRFLAALSLNALILLGVQAGSLLAVYAAETPPSAIGPFRPAAYLAAYGLVALPNALIATRSEEHTSELQSRENL